MRLLHKDYAKSKVFKTKFSNYPPMDLAKIKQYPAQISNVFKRFPLPMGLGCFSALYAMFLFRMAENNEFNFIQEHPRYFIWIAVFSVLSIFLTTATKLLQESMNLSPKKGWIITGASEAALGALTAGYIATGNTESDHFIAKMVVLVAVVVLSPLMAPFFKGKNDIPLWNFIGKVVISFLISAVITSIFYGAASGLAACAYVITEFRFFVDSLLFDLGAICVCVVFPTLFFAGFPNLGEPNENSETSRYFHNTIHFLFIPVLLLYIFFVYAYIIKFSISPSVELLALSTMSISAVLGTVLISSIIYPSHFKDNFDKKLLRIVPWFAIPLILYSTWNFIQNLSEASPSEIFILLYLILFHLWLLSSLIILLVPRIKKKIWWTMASLIIIAIISTFAPFNVFRVSAHYFINSKKHQQMERELRELEAKRAEEEIQIAAKTKRFEFNQRNTAPITIPANRHTVEILDNGYLNHNRVSMEGDSIFIQVRPNRSENDSTFMNFTVPVDLLNDEEKPLFLVLDNGSETLVLNYAYFKFVEGDENENYGSVRGYLFK